MTRSEQINELATALAKAQGEMKGAAKDSENPHFRSKYADLASVREACLGALTKHGLSVPQFPRLTSVGEGQWLVEVETTLLHTSGQWMTDTLAVPVTKVDAQGVGSAITYARRYALAAVTGVAPEDDDANAAVGHSNGHAAAKPEAPASAMDTVTGKVLGVISKPAGNTTKYVVTLDNQKTYSTFKKAVMDAAKAAGSAGREVEIVFKTSQYGHDIVTLKDLALDDEPPF